MAITVKHNKVSTIPDDADTSLVRPSDWNDDHVLTGTVPVANGGTGAATLTGYVYGNGTAAMTASTTIPSTAVTGLGTMSTQNSNNISVTGGSMSGVTISDYIATTQKGIANGVATLDGSGTVPISQLPSAVIGALSYQGTWNASTNTPTLTSSVGTKGYYYVVNVAGSTNLNGITDWQIGDWAVYNGTAWQKIDNTDAVTSVNGYTGTVVLTAADVSAVPYTGATGAVDLNAKSLTNVSHLGINTTSVPTILMRAIGDNNSSSRIAMRGYSSDANSSAIRVTKFRGTFSAPQAPQSGDSLGKFELAGYGTTSSEGYPQASLEGVATEAWGATARGTKALIKVTPNTTTTQVTALTIDQNSAATFASSVSATSFSGSGSGLTSIPNSALTNSAITINGTSTSLGGSISVGTVTSVTGTAPVVSSGGNTPAISMPKATTSVDGYLSATDWTTFNNKGSGTVTAISVTSANGFAGTSSGGATPALTLSTSITGVLKGNGTAISAATAGTDYSAGTSALTTGILKSTTTTGALSIAVAADFPTLNQNTTGSAATLTTPRAIYGNNFDGSAALTQIIASTYGGTGNGFTKFSGATTAEKTYTLPDSSVTLLYAGGPLGTPSSGALTNATGLPVGGISATGTPSSSNYLRGDGTWSSVTATTATNLAGGALGSIPYQLLSGSTLFLAGNTTTTPQFLTSTGVAGIATAPTYTSSTGSGNVVLATSPTLVTPNIGAASGTSLSLSSTIGASNFSGTSSGTNTGDQTNVSGSAGSVAGSGITGSRGIPKAAMPAGTVLQVLSATKTDTWSTSGAATWNDITGLSISITPTNSTSKILIFGNISIGTASGAASLVYRFVRGSTTICVGDAAGSRPQATGGFYAGDTAGSAPGASVSSMYLDSPATTSATTYKIQGTSSTGTTVYVNRTVDDRNTTGYDDRFTSTITVMEIAV